MPRLDHEAFGAVEASGFFPFVATWWSRLFR